MCGRYSLYSDPEVLAEHFGLDEVPSWSPRYNIAPSSDIPAIGLSREGRRRWSLLRWGLVPRWARDAGIGHKLINARAETVAEKPAFRDAFRSQRCLIPADGFFEWERAGEQRRPWYVRRRDGLPMAFAALWEQWKNPDNGERIASCTIITTAANRAIASIHDRMPVILERGDFDDWLSDDAAAEGLLRPVDETSIETFRVSTDVNNPRHDASDCIMPLASD